MTTAKADLAPVVRTQFMPRITRNGRTKALECWAAETTDGVWRFGREDSPGTPWLVTHKASGVMVHLTGNLTACREYVGAGHAQKDLDRIRAHERGEHDAARNSWCGRC
jgi:hypothetical protein